MKKSCYTVIVSLMCVLLVACGKQEQAKETADGFVEKEVISQTAEPVETEAPTDAPTEKPVVKPTEAPTSAPTEVPTEAPIELPFVPAF